MNCRLTEELTEVIQLIDEEKKHSKDYGTGVPLYHSEIMMLEMIARYPYENVSGLSKKLGITKGAVTQGHNKLMQKGLIEGHQKSDNKKEKYFRLTEKGRESIDGHQQYHEAANQRLCDYLLTMSQEETEVIFRFLSRLKQCVPFCEFQCGCSTEHPGEDYHDQRNVAQCTGCTNHPV